ncbi:MAG: hypothetical protein CBB72_006895 [Muricauda sp. TMED12]|nr:MAG: hypothetical protein CBB72_006895 [Muricauda sp. TMED12]
MDIMKVLSLFDGMSCGQIALNNIGIEPEIYYASEVEPDPIKVTQHVFPNTIQLGSVTEWRTWDIDWSTIDLVMGGSPCQGFSSSGRHGGTNATLDGVEIIVNSLPMYHAIKASGGEFLSHSHLFWVFVEIVEHVKKYNPNVRYMLENVKMSKVNLDMITTALGVDPVFIDSALVSAQSRQRYYWCNWKVEQPEDKGIVLADILESGVVDRDKSYCIDANYGKGGNPNHYFNKSRRQLVFPSVADCNLNSVNYRKLTVRECARLQTTPEYYIYKFLNSGMSNTQLYKMLGNGFTVEVIRHILSCNEWT